MTYPQPDSNIAVKSGLNFLRFQTVLSSPGDIYESEQGGYLLAVGPDSDIANISIGYFDEQTATKMSRVVISPQRALAGTVYARNDALYLPSKRPGKVLFWSNDMYVPNYQPTGSNLLSETVEIIPPNLDLLQYFQPQPSVTPKRSDRVLAFQSFENGLFPSGSYWLCVPYYGRKTGYINFTNRNGGNVDYGVRGVNFTTTLPSTQEQQETQLVAKATVADNASSNFVLNASTEGQFDYLVFEFDAAAPSAVILADLRLVFSDEE